MSVSSPTNVQQFRVSGAVMFGGNSPTPLHFGRSGGSLTVRGVEEIKVFNDREIRCTLPTGSSVVLSDENGERGFTVISGGTSLTIKATKVTIVG